MKPHRAERLVNASLSLPMVLRSRVGDGLPLQVRNRVRATVGEWHDVILPKTGTGTACFAGGWAGMLSLEFPRYLTRSVFPGLTGVDRATMTAAIIAALVNATRSKRTT